jgi:hypothetical protein
MPSSFKWEISTRFPHKTLYAFLFSPIHGICPNHFTLHNLITTMFGKKYWIFQHKSHSSMSQNKWDIKLQNLWPPC